MSKPEFRRLERIEVDRLFNVYDHRIDLKLDNRVTLLHGPNGSGKTVILRMIDALLNARLSYFERIPFSRLAIGFHDGSAIALHKSATDGNAATLKVYENGKEEHSAQVRLRTEAERITASIGHLQHHPTIPDAWIDTRDGKLLMSPEVISRYGDLFSQSNAEGDSPRTPVWFQSFLKAVNTHLIEEQRLFQFGEGHRDRPPRRRYWQSGASALVSTVVEYGHEFRTRLADTMADYGRQSQTLDQSFLHRLITAKEEMTVNELVCHISDIKKKTDELKNLGILEETQASPIPVGMLEDIDSTQARVMTLYVHDTTAKLAMLDALKDRSLLLCQAPVFDKVLAEFGTWTKIDAFEAREGSDVPTALLRRASVFGQLRWAHACGLNLCSEKIRIPRFLDEGTWQVDREGLIRAAAAGLEDELERCIGRLPKVQPWRQVRGHDVLEVLRIGLRNVLGDLPSSVGVSGIASVLRAAGGLEGTTLLDEIRRWEETNPPYLVLRPAS